MSVRQGFHSKDFLREGRDKHQGTCFLVDPEIARWGLERKSKAPRAERILFQYNAYKK